MLSIPSPVPISIPGRLGSGPGSWYHRGDVLRRALPLVLLPLCAACPTFAVGPEIYGVHELEPEVCEEAGIDEVPCSRFAIDNGPVIYNDPEPQLLVLVFGFEAFDRNLDHVTVQYERPGLPPSRLLCPFGYGLDDVSTEGLSCESVGLAGYDPESPQAEDFPTAEGASSGFIDLRVLIDAPEPGPHAISVWLTDDNALESPVLRWQFTVEEPVREDPTEDPPAEG